MIIDTSAAIAVMRHEPEAEEFLKTIAAASHVRISAASVLEMAIVSRADPGLAEDFVADMGFEVLDINAEHLYEAIRAQERFGRGSGSPAKLQLRGLLQLCGREGDGRAAAVQRRRLHPYRHSQRPFLTLPTPGPPPAKTPATRQRTLRQQCDTPPVG